jgi:G3E family GTPase
MTFLDRKYQELLMLDGITCVVDAEAILRVADLVLLNKTDLVTPAHVEVIREWIDSHLERISVVETVQGAAPREVSLGAGRFDAARMDAAATVAGGAGHGEGGAGFDRWSHRTDRLLDRGRHERMVGRDLPGSVYRCMGIVHIADAPANPWRSRSSGVAPSPRQSPERVSTCATRSWRSDAR